MTLQIISSVEGSNETVFIIKNIETKRDGQCVIQQL